MTRVDEKNWTRQEDGSFVRTVGGIQEVRPPTPEEEAQATSNGNGQNFSEMSLIELREELVKRGLPKTGNKADLIDRLQHA